MTDSYAGDFDLDQKVSYLNAAYISPMPHVAMQAGCAGIAERSRPWLRDPAKSKTVVEQTRALAASLIGAGADDLAIVGSVSNAISVACHNLPIDKGSRLIFLEDEHHSIVLTMRAVAERTGAILDAVRRPNDGDWTEAILERIDAAGSPVALAALTPVHWLDGTRIDLERIAPRLRQRAGKLVIDATQGAGILQLDVRALQPDFAAFPTYKWLLGPYGLAFLYVSPEHQQGKPLEEHAFNHRGPIVPLSPMDETPDYAEGARRFDRGQVENYATMPMALAAMTYLAEVGPAICRENIAELTTALGEGLEAAGIHLARPELRSPNILCFRPRAHHADGFARAMESAGVFVTYRYGICRVSPHIYNTDADIRRMLVAISEL